MMVKLLQFTKFQPQLVLLLNVCQKTTYFYENIGYQLYLLGVVEKLMKHEQPSVYPLQNTILSISDIIKLCNTAQKRRMI